MRHLLTLTCLLLALACYGAGLATGFMTFFALGMVAEGAFWIRQLGRRSR